MSCHFMQSHMSRVHVCLAVTYHLHFQQNSHNLLHATVVTFGRFGALTTEPSPLLLIERYQSTPEVLASNMADVMVL